MTILPTFKHLALLLLLSPSVEAGCPYMEGGFRDGTVLESDHLHAGRKLTGIKPGQAYAEELAKLDFNEIKADLKTLMTTSVSAWPADYGHYGPFFIRLAWHCNGSYRTSDGRGGCEGGRIRFDPERSWDDNTNLEKAVRLLTPLKIKHGEGLSWGDLITLAGTVAIEAMGGPVLGFCAGRIDDEDGSESILLGPTQEQEKFAPCEVEGNCTLPLGSEVVGLIYVNPEGPFGNPVPEETAPRIREVFARMGFDDEETVALVGGGHAFGKTHGACPAGAGPSPEEDPFNSWPGLCGSGRGNDTSTSGFEGPWTTTPTTWTNTYFQNLVNLEYELHVGPGGKNQWRVRGDSSPTAPVPFPPNSPGKQDLMMLTADLAFTKDEEYMKIVQKFADDIGALNDAFSKAWYKLTSHDMGPVTRCAGDLVPPAQPFQYPLPEPSSSLASPKEVESVVADILDVKSDAHFIRLAWQCSSTYRATDFSGGCNGARIRFEPGSTWETNKGLDTVLEKLSPIHSKFSDDSLSHADLIVLAGTAALKRAGVPENAIPFCPGRVDDTDGTAWKDVEFGNKYFPETVDDMIELFHRRGFTTQEMVALMGGGHRLGQMNPFDCENDCKIEVPESLSTEYFKDILTLMWTEVEGDTGLFQADKDGKTVYAHFTDLALVFYPEMSAWAQYYVSAGDETFVRDFAAAWTKIVTADRFDGPTGNVCVSSDETYQNDPPVDAQEKSLPVDAQKITSGAAGPTSLACGWICLFVVTVGHVVSLL